MSVLQKEQIGRHETKEKERVAIKPISDMPGARPAAIFGNCQRLHIADTAAIEVPRRRVVDRVLFPPDIVGRHRENTQKAPCPIVAPSVAKERPMAAVMLNHEGADQKRTIQGRDECGKRITDLEGTPSQRHQQGKWTKRDQKLEDAALWRRLPILRKDQYQSRLLSGPVTASIS